MSYEIVNAIQEAEQKGNEIVENALNLAKRTSEETKNFTTSIIQEGKLKSKKTAQAIIDSAQQDTISKKQQIDDEANMQIRYLHEKSKENQQKAIDVIIERIVS